MTECFQWLLYSSGELSRNSFEEHLRNCECCRKDLADYAKDKNIFSVDVLGEVPSIEIDNEILRVCSDRRLKILSFSFARKMLVPVMLFVVAFISIGYIVMNIENAKQARNTVVRSDTTVVPDSSQPFVVGNNEGIIKANSK